MVGTDFVVRVDDSSAPRKSGTHVAFIFSRGIRYPPVIHNIKSYYVTREMVRRGVKVDWVQLGGQERRWHRGGINFAVLAAPRGSHLPDVLSVVRLALYCILSGVRIVYLDEWSFFRRKPISRLAVQMALRALGVKLVLDQRDPYVDFEEATGELDLRKKNGGKFTLLRSLLLRQTDLIILPSEAYSALYVSEGIPARKVLGTFRGIDTTIFKPQSEEDTRRLSLGLQDKFVIGWFGLMHSYRMIREIIVPLIRNLSQTMPEAHFLIGGEGPLMPEFERLNQSESSKSFSLLGTVPYDRLPAYIAACDVTICPVSTSFRFSTRSNWLKIAESLAVGTPVVATRTEISSLDFKDLKGVVWVSSDYDSFLGALKGIREDGQELHEQAGKQAENFKAFSTAFTIPKVVDRVLGTVKSA